MRLVDIEQRTPEWLAWRAQGIGASEAPVIMGESPYQTPHNLWGVKSGLIEPPDLSGNPNVRRGVGFEDAALACFEEMTGEIAIPTCGEHQDFPFVRASFDGWAPTKTTEIKCPYPAHAWWADLPEMVKRLDGPQVLKEIGLGVYYGQTQHQMLVAGVRQSTLFLYNAETDAGYPLLIPANDDYQIELLKKEIEFWQWVRTGKEPPLDNKRDIFRPADRLTPEQLVQWQELQANWLAEESKRLAKAKEVEDIKAEQEKLRNALVVLMGDFLKAQDEINITRFTKRGAVDYAKVLNEVAPNTPEEVIERHRRKSSNQITVTVPKAEGESKGKGKGRSRTTKDEAAVAA